MQSRIAALLLRATVLRRSLPLLPPSLPRPARASNPARERNISINALYR
jgi:hypothetical protein